MFSFLLLLQTHQLPLTYDFHKYMIRSMEEEFRDTVGIRYCFRLSALDISLILPTRSMNPKVLFFFIDSSGLKWAIIVFLMIFSFEFPSLMTDHLRTH